MKNNHISSFWSMKKICQFIHQHILIVVQTWLHACAIYHKILDCKVNDNKYNECERERFNNFNQFTYEAYAFFRYVPFCPCQVLLCITLHIIASNLKEGNFHTYFNYT